MKVAILTNYPLFDNAGWKVELTKMLISMGFEVSVYYGKSGFWNQAKAVFRKLNRNKVATSAVRARSGKKIRSNLSEFKKLSVPIYQLENLNSLTAAEIVSREEIDYCICALDQILLRQVVAAYPKLLNIHYGCLPEIKGASAAEWTLVEQGELKITLHEIDEGVDTGLIYGVYPVDLSGLESLSEIRNKIQECIPSIIVDYFNESEKYKGLDNLNGHLYTFMHKDLSELLEKSLVK